MALHEDLEVYSEWCRGKRLFLERERVLRLILELDPENADALRVLGYRKGADGTWQAPKKPKTFTNRDKSALAESPDRYQAALAPFLLEMEVLLDADLAVERLEQAQQDVLHYDPDHARVRSMRHEVQLDGLWVLAETATAKARRAELRELVRQGFEQAPRPTRGDLTPTDKDIGLAWKGPFVTPIARALGTGEEEEPLRMVQALNATVFCFGAIFGVEASLHPNCTVYLLADPAQKTALLAGHTAIDANMRAAYEKLEGTGIQGTGDFAFWAEGAARRIDGVVRIAIGWLLADGYGITIERAWIYEGFGLYLTRALVRTRLNWFVQPSASLDAEAEAQLRGKMLEPDTNWMDEAYQVLQRPDRPRFAGLVKKNSFAYTVEDVLYSYALAAYLLEARWQETPELLQRIGRGAPTFGALEQTLGLTPEELDEQVLRWLSERR